MKSEQYYVYADVYGSDGNNMSFSVDSACNVTITFNEATKHEFKNIPVGSYMVKFTTDKKLEINNKNYTFSDLKVTKRTSEIDFKKTFLNSRNIADDNTEVYTYQLDLTKTFNNKSASECEVDASNVVFQLFDENSNAINLIKLTDGSYTIYNGSVENISVTKDISPTKEGNLSIKGFKEGKYFLKEIATDDKCILLASNVYI